MAPEEGLRRSQRKRRSRILEGRGSEEPSGSSTPRARSLTTAQRPPPPNSTDPPTILNTLPYQLRPLLPLPGQTSPLVNRGRGQHTVYRTRDEIPPHVRQRSIVHPASPSSERLAHYRSSTFASSSRTPYPSTLAPSDSRFLFPPIIPAARDASASPGNRPAQTSPSVILPSRMSSNTATAFRIGERGGFGGWQEETVAVEARTGHPVPKRTATHGDSHQTRSATSASRRLLSDTSDWYVDMLYALKLGSMIFKSLNNLNGEKH